MVLSSIENDCPSLSASLSDTNRLQFQLNQEKMCSVFSKTSALQSNKNKVQCSSPSSPKVLQLNENKAQGSPSVATNTSQSNKKIILSPSSYTANIILPNDNKVQCSSPSSPKVLQLNENKAQGSPSVASNTSPSNKKTTHSPSSYTANVILPNDNKVQCSSPCPPKVLQLNENKAQGSLSVATNTSPSNKKITMYTSSSTNILSNKNKAQGSPSVATSMFQLNQEKTCSVFSITSALQSNKNIVQFQSPSSPKVLQSNKNKAQGSLSSPHNQLQSNKNKVQCLPSSPHHQLTNAQKSKSYKVPPLLILSGNSVSTSGIKQKGHLSLVQSPSKRTIPHGVSGVDFQIKSNPTHTLSKVPSNNIILQPTSSVKFQDTSIPKSTSSVQCPDTSILQMTASLQHVDTNISQSPLSRLCLGHNLLPTATNMSPKNVTVALSTQGGSPKQSMIKPFVVSPIEILYKSLDKERADRTVRQRKILRKLFVKVDSTCLGKLENNVTTTTVKRCVTQQVETNVLNTVHSLDVCKYGLRNRIAVGSTSCHLNQSNISLTSVITPTSNTSPKTVESLPKYLSTTLPHTPTKKVGVPHTPTKKVGVPHTPTKKVGVPHTPTKKVGVDSSYKVASSLPCSYEMTSCPVKNDFKKIVVVANNTPVTTVTSTISGLSSSTSRLLEAETLPSFSSGGKNFKISKPNLVSSYTTLESNTDDSLTKTISQSLEISTSLLNTPTNNLKYIDTPSKVADSPVIIVASDVNSLPSAGKSLPICTTGTHSVVPGSSVAVPCTPATSCVCKYLPQNTSNDTPLIAKSTRILQWNSLSSKNKITILQNLKSQTDGSLKIIPSVNFSKVLDTKSVSHGNKCITVSKTTALSSYLTKTSTLISESSGLVESYKKPLRGIALNMCTTELPLNQKSTVLTTVEKKSSDLFCEYCKKTFIHKRQFLFHENTYCKRNIKKSQSKKIQSSEVAMTPNQIVGNNNTKLSAAKSLKISLTTSATGTTSQLSKNCTNSLHSPNDGINPVLSSSLPLRDEPQQSSVNFLTTSLLDHNPISTVTDFYEPIPPITGFDKLLSGFETTVFTDESSDDTKSSESDDRKSSELVDTKSSELDDTKSTEPDDNSTKVKSSEPDNRKSSELDYTKYSELDDTKSSELDDTKSTEPDDNSTKVKSSEPDNRKSSELDYTKYSELDDTKSGELDDTKSSEPDDNSKKFKSSEPDDNSTKAHGPIDDICNSIKLSSSHTTNYNNVTTSSKTDVVYISNKSNEVVTTESYAKPNETKLVVTSTKEPIKDISESTSDVMECSPVDYNVSSEWDDICSVNSPASTIGYDLPEETDYMENSVDVLSTHANSMINSLENAHQDVCYTGKRKRRHSSLYTEDDYILSCPTNNVDKEICTRSNKRFKTDSNECKQIVRSKNNTSPVQCKGRTRLSRLRSDKNKSCNENKKHQLRKTGRYVKDTKNKIENDSGHTFYEKTYDSADQNTSKSNSMSKKGVCGIIRRSRDMSNKSSSILNETESKNVVGEINVIKCQNNEINRKRRRSKRRSAEIEVVVCNKKVKEFDEKTKENMNEFEKESIPNVSSSQTVDKINTHLEEEEGSAEPTIGTIDGNNVINNYNSNNNTPEKNVEEKQTCKVNESKNINIKDGDSSHLSSKDDSAINKTYDNSKAGHNSSQSNDKISDDNTGAAMKNHESVPVIFDRKYYSLPLTRRNKRESECESESTYVRYGLYYTKRTNLEGFIEKQTVTASELNRSVNVNAIEHNEGGEIQGNNRILEQDNAIEHNEGGEIQGNNRILEQDNNRILEQDNNRILEQDNNRILEQDNNHILEQDNNHILEQDNNRILEQDNNHILEQDTDCSAKSVDMEIISDQSFEKNKNADLNSNLFTDETINSNLFTDETINLNLFTDKTINVKGDQQNKDTNCKQKTGGCQFRIQALNSLDELYHLVSSKGLELVE